MALSPVYENTNTLKKLTVGGATYFLKDADLRVRGRHCRSGR